MEEEKRKKEEERRKEQKKKRKEEAKHLLFAVKGKCDVIEINLKLKKKRIWGFV